MGQRSRKRRRTSSQPGRQNEPAAKGRSGGPTRPKRPTANGRGTGPGGVRPPAGEAGGPFGARVGPEPSRRERNEARAEAIRAELEPLAPNERPPALIASCVLAVLSAAATIGPWVAGVDPPQDASITGALLLAGILLVAAVGAWYKRYWALLGLQMWHGLAVVIAFIALLAYLGDPLGMVVCTAIVVIYGYLFWKFVRVLARVHIPGRPPRG